MDYHYSVKGGWPFPLDMLRRDRAVPASKEDQAVIDSLSGPHAPDRDAIRLDHVVKLVIKDAGRDRPDTARWRSFGWDVPDDKEFRQVIEQSAKVGMMESLYASAMAKLTPEEREALDWFRPQPQH